MTLRCLSSLLILALMASVALMAQAQAIAPTRQCTTPSNSPTDSDHSHTDADSGVRFVPQCIQYEQTAKCSAVQCSAVA